MTCPFYDVDNALGFLTITASRLMSGYFRKQLTEAGFDLTAEQWGVLAQIWNKGSLSQDALAGRLCVDKSSLSRVLDVMERKGLVTRVRDPEDARRKILYATEEADHLRMQCRDIAHKVMTDLLRDIPDEEHAICLKVLTRVKQTIRELS